MVSKVEYYLQEGIQTFQLSKILWTVQFAQIIGFGLLIMDEVILNDHPDVPYVQYKSLLIIANSSMIFMASQQTSHPRKLIMFHISG